MERAAEAKERLAQADADLEILDPSVPSPTLNRSARRTQEMALGTFRDSPAQEIWKELERHRDQILKVSNRSRNLKGVYRKHIQDAAATINAAKRTFEERNENEEFRRLERQNANLQSEVPSCERKWKLLVRSFKKEIETRVLPGSSLLQHPRRRKG